MVDVDERRVRLAPLEVLPEEKERVRNRVDVVDVDDDFVARVVEDEEEVEKGRTAWAKW